MTLVHPKTQSPPRLNDLQYGMRPTHHRMLSILQEEDYIAWLDPLSPLKVLKWLIATRDWKEMQINAIPKLAPDASA
jgi:putative SOS response-associated peptidase YedK